MIAWAGIIAQDDLLAHRPLNEVQNIADRPLAIVHGLADLDLDVHHATDLAAAHASFVRGSAAWLVPGAPHLQAAFAAPAEYERQIVAFFGRNLGSGNAEGRRTLSSRRGIC